MIYGRTSLDMDSRVNISCNLFGPCNRFDLSLTLASWKGAPCQFWMANLFSACGVKLRHGSVAKVLLHWAAENATRGSANAKTCHPERCEILLLGPCYLKVSTCNSQPRLCNRTGRQMFSNFKFYCFLCFSPPPADRFEKKGVRFGFKILRDTKTAVEYFIEVVK